MITLALPPRIASTICGPVKARGRISGRPAASPVSMPTTNG